MSRKGSRQGVMRKRNGQDMIRRKRTENLWRWPIEKNGQCNEK